MADPSARESVSRHDFAEAVRATTNAKVAASGHHPGDSYTPAAFRHYVRERAILRCIHALGPASALDVGCSEGYFMRVLERDLGFAPWGVDIATVSVARAKERHGFQVAAAEATKLPFPDGAFDLVYSTEVIEHVLDPHKMLAEMRRVARRWVLVTTPISESADAHAPDYEMKDEGHVNNFDPETMRSLFGPTARYGSFRNNATFALLAGGARKLPAPIRDRFYALDYQVSQRYGRPMHPVKALRNRDWLVVDQVDNAPSNEPRWACPSCQGLLEVSATRATCESCGREYAIRDDVIDFFG